MGVDEESYKEEMRNKEILPLDMRSKSDTSTVLLKM
jgi:hypothetical protein